MSEGSARNWEQASLRPLEASDIDGWESDKAHAILYPLGFGDAMPLVVIKVSSSFKQVLDAEQQPVTQLANDIRKTAAYLLSCMEGGSLTRDDIQVIIHEVDPATEPGNSDIMLLVIAHEYSERKRALEHIAHELREYLIGWLPHRTEKIRGGVWVLLAPSAYASL